MWLQESNEPMHIGIDYGLEHLDLEVRDTKLVALYRQPLAPPVNDRQAAVREALEKWATHLMTVVAPATSPTIHHAPAINAG